MKKYSLLLLLLLIPYYAFAAKVADGYDYLKFSTNEDGTCSVVGYKDNLPELTIPSEVTIDGKTYTVTTIGKDAFHDCTLLTSVDIPNSVTSIGDSAFGWCFSLHSVVISSTVTKIEDSAFDLCRKLNRLIFKGATCPDFGNDVFSVVGNCTVYVPEGVSVDSYSSALTNAGLNISEIKTYEHYEGDYPDLVFKPVTGKDGECSVKANPDNKPQGEFTIPSTILKVDGNIYNVTTIEAYGFDDCYALTSITIPEGVTEIEQSAFQLCASLTSVMIPSSVTSIEEFAFYYCNKLKSLIFTGETCPTFGNNILKYSDKCTVYVPEGAMDSYLEPLAAVNVDASRVKGYIEENEFKDILVFEPIEGKDGECSVAKAKDDITGDNGKLVIPSTILKENGNIYIVTSIKLYGFIDCTKLTSVEIPNSVTSIGERAFSRFPSLTSVKIPNSVTSIGNNAFSYCEALISVEIPNSVTSIGRSAFEECKSLTSVKIPDSVTLIDVYAFYGCNELTSVEIPRSVTSIGKSTFGKCKNLNSLIFKREVCPAIDKDVFYTWGDKYFTDGTVYVPEGAVGSYLEPLATAGVDASRVKGYVEESACKELVFTKIDDTTCSVAANPYNELQGEVSIPSTILKADGNIYNVTAIEANAFGECTSLTSVEIPNLVTSIGNRAFEMCSSLTSVEIPNSVTEIGEYTFAYCNKLKSLIFMGETCPETLGTDILDGVRNCTVYVLNETLVPSFDEKFPGKVKPLLDITTETGMYFKTEEPFNIELAAYPDGYSPEGLIYSVTEGTPTITGNVITGHGAATVRVTDTGNADIYAETTLNVYVSGDSNDNGTVDITDAVNTANYIVGKEPEQFLKIAANVVDPEEDKISIADVVATVDIVLEAPAPAPSEAPKALYAPANTADCLTLRADAEGIALSLVGEGVFSALQVDVTLPAGAVLNGVSAGDRLTARHSVMYRMVDDCTVRVAVFALSLDSFVPGEAVVKLDVEGIGAGEGTACNVIASDAEGHGYRLGVDGGGMTGIEGVVPGEGAVVRASGDGITVEGAQGMAVEVYGMDGRLVRNITAGDDSITIDVAPGVYIVRVGAAPAVKIAVR